MCLGIPGQIVEIIDKENMIAKAEVSGVRRNVNVGLLAEGEDAVGVGDWVLIHVGFAMSKIDEQEAAQTLQFLEQLGEPFEQEMAELRESATADRAGRRAPSGLAAQISARERLLRAFVEGEGERIAHACHAMARCF